MIHSEHTRAEIRKLARKGKLMDTAFKVFQRAVYPAAPPEQVAELRTAFMAGAAELVALMTAGSDDTAPEEVGAEEEAMVFACFEEIERYHKRVVEFAAAPVKGGVQ